MIEDLRGQLSSTEKREVELQQSLQDALDRADATEERARSSEGRAVGAEARASDLATQVVVLGDEKANLQLKLMEIGLASFKNAKEQLLLLNPGVITEGVDVNHYVSDGAIVRVDPSTGAPQVVYPRPLPSLGAGP